MKRVGMKLLIWSIATPILLLVTMGLTSFPTTAFAASGPCYASSCNGKDAYAIGCANNDQTITKAYASWNGQTVATVWNHYSIDCKANWAEYQLTSYGRSNGCSFTVSINDYKGGGPSSSYGPYNGPSVAWTNMIDGTPYTSATISGSCYVPPPGIPQQVNAQANQ